MKLIETDVEQTTKADSTPAIKSVLSFLKDLSILLLASSFWLMVIVALVVFEII